LKPELDGNIGNILDYNPTELTEKENEDIEAAYDKMLLLCKMIFTKFWYLDRLSKSKRRSQEVTNMLNQIKNASNKLETILEFDLESQMNVDSSGSKGDEL
jgi:hypothetical protein